MDKLPPELLLEIAGYCDFLDVCALSEVNPLWNEVIESNWNSLKKANVKHIELEENDYEIRVDCVFQFKDGRMTSLMLKVTEGSEHVDVSELLENCWNYVVEDCWDPGYERFVQPSDKNKFLKDLFAPIFLSSPILDLGLSRLKSSTLQVVIALLERYHTPINELYMEIGHQQGYWRSSNGRDVQELADSARIVELAKPGKLYFSLADSFTEEEVCEHFKEKIAKLDIPNVTVLCPYFFEGSKRVGLERNRPMGHGPLPKCRYLTCNGSDRDYFASALDIPDMVDLVEYEKFMLRGPKRVKPPKVPEVMEIGAQSVPDVMAKIHTIGVEPAASIMKHEMEWSKNERDIVHYDFQHFTKECDMVPERFEQALKERNLPVRFDVVEENAEFLIKKIATRGDSQDELRVSFSFRQYNRHEVGASDDEFDELSKTDYVVFRTNEGADAWS